MGADFSPDDEDMAQVPLPDLHPSPTDKDISLGAKPKGSPTPGPSLEEFARRKSLLVADGADSDSAATRALPPALVDALPGRSCVRASSRAKSRAPSRSSHSKSRAEDRSRSRASPERRILDGKARIATVSGNAGSLERLQSLCLLLLRLGLCNLLCSGCRKMHLLLSFGMTSCDGRLFLFRGNGQVTANAGQVSILDFTSTSHRPTGLVTLVPILVAWLLEPYPKTNRLMSLGFAGPALNQQAQGLITLHMFLLFLNIIYLHFRYHLGER